GFSSMAPASQRRGRARRGFSPRRGAPSWRSAPPPRWGLRGGGRGPPPAGSAGPPRGSVSPAWGGPRGGPRPAPPPRPAPARAAAPAHGLERTAVRERSVGLDRLIHHRLRLGVLSALAAAESLAFNDLKALLGATDGNLSVQCRKLEDAHYLICTKTFDRRRP